MVVPYSGFLLHRIRLYWGVTTAVVYIILVSVRQPIRRIPEHLTTSPELIRFLLRQTETEMGVAAVLAVPLTLLLQLLYWRIRFLM